MKNFLSENSTVVKAIQSFLKKRGLKIGRFPEPDRLRRKKILNYFEIQALIDVGANVGSYGREMREIGFSGQIFSFEPTSEAYHFLEKKCKKDPKWKCEKIGLGNKSEELEINISINSKSSSILEILPLSTENAPDSRFHQKEKIQIKTLNELLPRILPETNKIMLKVDTQGFERQVLEGASEVMDRIKVVQLELSFEPLYKGEPTFETMISLMKESGFELFSLETDLSFTNPKNGKMLQVDCIFGKKE